MGWYLGNNFINLGLYDKIDQVMKEFDLDLNEIIEQELDFGLGNGGLGCLVVCFFDFFVFLEVLAIGYGICYEFGIFYQCIQDGWQVEVFDNWLWFGNFWEIFWVDELVEVKLGGYMEIIYNEKN